MSTKEIDAYPAALQAPKRSTLEALRATILDLDLDLDLDLVPEPEQGMSYGVPAFRVEGKVVAGFAAFKNHLSYLTHSGSVFPELKEGLAGYKTSTGAWQFPTDRPLPQALVRELLAVTRRQAFGASEMSVPDRPGRRQRPRRA